MVISRKAKGWAALMLAIPILLGFGPGGLLQAEIDLIRLYQQRASPLVASVVTCRFDPSCSHFGRDALQELGFWKGNLLIGARLLHCSPIGFVWDVVGSRLLSSGIWNLPQHRSDR